MSEEKTLKALYATVNQLEYQLAQLGADPLLWQIERPEGGLVLGRQDRSATL